MKSRSTACTPPPNPARTKADLPQRHRDTEKDKGIFFFLCVSVTLWLNYLR